MSQTDVMQRIAQLAKVGGALQPQNAIESLAAVIDHLDMYSETYEADVAALMAAGASILDLSSGPTGVRDPSYVPLFLRS